MPSESNYFDNLAKRAEALRGHGFDHFPSDKELLDYLMETNDNIDLVAGALGLRLEKDWRGRFHLTCDCGDR